MGKLVLIGFMGAGKTSAARALGDGAKDVDLVIESRSRRRVSDIFAQDGEATFRTLEEQTALELLDDPTVSAVALGGGALGSGRIRDAIVRHTVVWLDVDADTAWRRVQRSPGRRPLARDEERFRALHRDREATYAELAHAIVPGDRAREFDRIAPALADRAGAPDGTTVLWASAASADYPVFVAPGLVTRHRFWPPGVGGRRVLVTDYNAGREYAGRLEPYLGEIRIMPGEQSKTVAHAEIVWTEMVRSGVTRGDVVVALGGGVIGDLAGFCAATYQRGLRCVGVPTTLVAQVDSAYGGKTGVDLAEAKNYVGAFHQPAAVLVDPATLATLPAAERAAGYAEVVKTALIAGGELWDRVAAGADPTDPWVITRCALTKLRIVARDERDGGLRQLLNLGHTVGHAIETSTGYARYRHGEAVGLGLLAALRLSGADALRDEVEGLIAEQGLPTVLDSSVDLEQIIFHTGRDKKRTGEGPTPFVLCTAPGQCQYGQTVSPADLRAAVRELYG